MQFKQIIHSMPIKGKRRICIRDILHEIYQHRVLYILVLIPLAVLIIFSYIPMYGVQIAFKDYQPALGFTRSPWVSFKHFNRFMESPVFWKILKNTLVLNVYGLATFPLALILALMLNYIPSQFFKKTVQTVSYIPYFLSTVVMCGMILQFLDARSGILNAFLGIFRIAPANYMANPAAFPHIYIWSGVWQGVGYSSIIYIASLAGVSPELHEAAIVDGASIWRRIWHVDIPGILPTICILLILAFGGIMNSNTEKILLLQNSLNNSVSEVISTFVYKQGFVSSIPQYSYSSAIGLFNSIINVILLVTVNKIVKKISGNSMW